MPTIKSERKKIYIVIVLALVAAIVGYFRFIHKKPPPDIGRTASIATPSQVQTPQAEISMPDRQRDKQPELHMDDVSPTVIRDIFSPVQLTKMPKSTPKPKRQSSKAKSKPKPKKSLWPIPPKLENLPERKTPPPPPPPPPTVVLKLNGTILGGENPIAIINNQFVRTGEWIGGYRIVKIDKYKVLLSSNNHQKVLEVSGSVKK